MVYNSLFIIRDNSKYIDSVLDIGLFIVITPLIYNIYEVFIYALREPNATSVVKNGFGYVVAYIGELGGNVPYTAYNARKSYIEKNPDIIEKFSRAVNRGLQYVDSHSAEEIASIVSEYFPDTSLSDMITIVNRYKEGEAWKKNITINEDEWNHIQEIMDASSELDKYVDYDKLIYDKYFDEYE